MALKPRKIVSASFIRPANTTAYASGDLVANHVTAGSVVPVPLPVARVPGGSGVISRIRLAKTGVDPANAQFRVHLFRDLPAVTNGDNGVFLANGRAKQHLGHFDVTIAQVHSDGADGVAVPAAGSALLFEALAGSKLLYALIEARAAYVPVSAETFTITAEVARD